MKRLFIRDIVVQFILLVAFWLLLSGHYDVFHVSMGIISALLVVALNFRLKKYFFYKEKVSQAESSLERQYPVTLNFFSFLRYIPWLLWQVMVASLQVAYVVLRPRMPINPSLIIFKTKLPNTSARVILGNSITLTPGTITVQLDGDEFVVHSLMDESFSGIVDGSLPEHVARLYEKKPGHVVGKFKIIRSKRDM